MCRWLRRTRACKRRQDALQTYVPHSSGWHDDFPPFDGGSAPPAPAPPALAADATALGSVAAGASTGAVSSAVTAPSGAAPTAASAGALASARRSSAYAAARGSSVRGSSTSAAAGAGSELPVRFTDLSLCCPGSERLLFPSATTCRSPLAHDC